MQLPQRTILLLAGLAAAGCGDKSAAPPATPIAAVAEAPAPPPRPLEDSIRTWVPATPVSSTPLPLPVPVPPAIVVDSILRFPLRNGDTLDIIGTRYHEEKMRRLTYEGHADGAPFHIVTTTYNEGHDRFLVHDSTGKRSYVDAAPIASPSRRELLVPSWAASDYGTPKTLSVYLIDGDTLRAEFRMGSEVWGPKEAHWVGNDTILLVMGEYSNRGPHREAPAYLARESGRWVLHNEPAVPPAPFGDDDLAAAGIGYKNESSSVRRILGTPDSVTATVWYYRDVTVYFEKARVEQILLRTPRYATVRGLRVGDDISKAADLYGGGGWGDEAALVYNHLADQQDFDERGMIVERDGTRITGIRLGAVQSAD